ncbi:MAG: Preprotein translocase, SecG subunit [candidate division Kazan bacterium GW2011_GWA1_44_22]|uniref:Protein-export membrane protein SecG n=1 Tax=candidate division Kazan bacterium GW2011_GWA1_44_22 TaxID=1620410 RepID=A0A0G1KV83_UNCK3|nr:MAG: Preprotein translocase, SecG subunit [candidate division Kazan bacterium GW2011_GWA1_44_22]
MIGNILMIVQVVLAIILMVSILVQGRGTSLGEAFGGSSSFYTTRRGAERTLFVITIVVAVLFVATALVSLFFK